MIRRIMSDVPGVWYVLLTFVAIFGVATWCLDKFSSKDDLKKITAYLRYYLNACSTLCHIYNRGALMSEGSWSDFIPVRLPVEWEYRGEPGLHPDIEGITGKEVVLLIEKRFTRFERILAKFMKAPKSFEERCIILNLCFGN